MISERVRMNLEVQVSEIEEKERKLAHRKAMILARLKSAQNRKLNAEVHEKVVSNGLEEEEKPSTGGDAIRDVMDLYITGSYNFTPLNLDQLVDDLSKVGGTNASLKHVLEQLGKKEEFEYTTERLPEGENPLEIYGGKRVLR